MLVVELVQFPLQKRMWHPRLTLAAALPVGLAGPSPVCPRLLRSLSAMLREQMGPGPMAAEHPATLALQQQQLKLLHPVGSAAVSIRFELYFSVQSLTLSLLFWQKALKEKLLPPLSVTALPQIVPISHILTT